MQFFQLFTFVLLCCFGLSFSSAESTQTTSSSSSSATPFMNGSLVDDSPAWNIYFPTNLVTSGYFSLKVESESSNFRFGSAVGSEVNVINITSGEITPIDSTKLTTNSSKQIYYTTLTYKNLDLNLSDDLWIRCTTYSNATKAGPYEASGSLKFNLTSSNEGTALSATVEESTIVEYSPSPYMDVSLAQDGSPIFDYYFPSISQMNNVVISESYNYSENFNFASYSVDIDGVAIKPVYHLFTSSSFIISAQPDPFEYEWFHLQINTTVVSQGTYYLTVQGSAQYELIYTYVSASVDAEESSSSESISTVSSAISYSTSNTDRTTISSSINPSSSSSTSTASSSTPFISSTLDGDSPLWNVYIPSNSITSEFLYIYYTGANGNMKFGKGHKADIINFVSGETSDIPSSEIKSNSSSLSGGSMKLTNFELSDNEWFHLKIPSNAVSIGPYNLSVSIGFTSTKYDLVLNAIESESTITMQNPAAYMNASLAEDGSPIFDYYFPGAIQVFSEVVLAESNKTTNYHFSSISIDIDNDEITTGLSTTVDSTFLQAIVNIVLDNDQWLHMRVNTTLVDEGEYFLEILSGYSNRDGFNASYASASIGTDDNDGDDTCYSDSETFLLELDGSGTELDGYSIYIASESQFYASADATGVYGQLLTNTTLLVDGHIAGIGKNYLSLEALSTSFIIAEPWTIVDGYLKLYNDDFHAVPSGETNVWALGSINAAAGRSDMRLVKIKARALDGNLLGNCGTTEVSDASTSSSFSSSYSSSISSSITVSSSTTPSISKSFASVSASDIISSYSSGTEEVSSSISFARSTSQNEISASSTSTSSSTSSLISTSQASSNQYSSTSIGSHSDSVYATGSLVNGEPTFAVYIPSTYQPWSSVEASGSKEGNYNFKSHSNSLSLNESTVLFNNTNFDVIITQISYSSEALDLIFEGVSTGSLPFVFEGTIVISSGNYSFVKRSDLTFDVSYTITDNAAKSTSSTGTTSQTGSSTPSSSISSTSTSTSDTTALSSSEVNFSSSSSNSNIAFSSTAANSVTFNDSSSKSTGSNGVSTVVTNKVSTTVVTITSCSSNKCQEEAVTTGVTVVTTTLSGEVTIYTTYCPLSTEFTSSSGVSTSTQAISSTESTASTGYETISTTTSQTISNKVTTFTVTSCSSNVCSTTTVVGFTTLTETLEASSTSPAGQNGATASIEVTSNSAKDNTKASSTLAINIDTTADTSSAANTAHIANTANTSNTASSASVNAATSDNTSKSANTAATNSRNDNSASSTTVQIATPITGHSSASVSQYEGSANVNAAGLTGIIGLVLFGLLM